MNLDRFCYLLIFSLLPILILPLDFLPLGIIGAFALLFLALKQRSALWLLLSILIALSYGRVMYFAENLQKQTAYKSRETIQIQQILKQGEHPTAIAKRANGEKIYLRWRSETPLILSQTYQAELQLRPIASRLNEGNFNRQRWFIARHIVATATVRKAELNQVQISNARAKWFVQTLEQTNSFNTQGLMLALAFGERAWLNAEQWQLFQQTATAHLIAISGLHIALAMGVGFWLGKGIAWGIGWACYRLKLRQAVQNPYFFALFCGFVTAWGYSFLAGFAIPTMRAVIAISFVLICRWARRYYTPWQFWLRCVSLLIVLDPLALLSDSFWLSILAVAVLIFWYHYFPLKNIYQPKANWFKPVAQLVHLQLGILFCFLPIQLYFFEGFSPYAFFANLLIVPFYSLIIVPLILFSLLINPFGLGWYWVDFLLQKSLLWLELFSNSWLILSSQAQWAVVCINLFLLSLIYWRKQLKQMLSLLIVGMLAIYQSYFIWQRWQNDPEIEWLHFDVGQGLAMAFVYINENGQKRAMLYDTGSSWESGSMAELEIIPYFKRNKITLDSIILSHDDNDHAGGVLPLLAKYPQAKLISPSQKNYGKKSEPCIVGKSWQFANKLQLSAIYPQTLVERAKNEHSCIIVGRIGLYRFLLTGDSGTEQEQQFAEQVGKIDFLQVGHHGSRTSTSYTLLANTKPQYAFISTARFNQWKMPHYSVVSRLDEFGIQHFNTAQAGMVKVKFYEQNYQILEQRHLFSAWYSSYWGR